MSLMDTRHLLFEDLPFAAKVNQINVPPLV